MGGWMTYQRMRKRMDGGGIMRKPLNDPDPYWRIDELGQRDISAQMIVGDMNRMERDYLSPEYPKAPFATRQEGSDPSSECADATGIDVATVRKVLNYVFMEQT